jgi:3-deoxy-D-manno-octulosonic acid kinase
MNTLKKKYKSIHFGLSSDLTNQQLQTLADIFSQRPGSADSVLGGRGSICMTDVEGIGPIAIKHYFRGGIIRFLIKQRYLKLGKVRSQIEYEILKKVRHIGIAAPEPIAYAISGFPFYKAWLVTRKIQTRQSLADLSISDLKHACMVMENVIEQVSLLIKNKILHVDLHPGNVVVDNNSKAYLVDFDKARIFSGTRQKLINRYLSRWKRAVVKHNLPDMLWKMMDRELSSLLRT